MCKHKKIRVIFILLLLTISATAQVKKINGLIGLQVKDNDSMHVVTATVTDSITAKPLQKVELTFYVQRMFGQMKIGTATTDTTGIATTEFAKNARGDETGKVIFIAKVEDDDVMNDRIIQLPLKADLPHELNKPMPRAMIGRYAPWWLFITFTLIVGTVSLLFLYVLYLVYRIKKASTLKIISSQTK